MTFMRGTLRPWGNSAAVVIPKDVMVQEGLRMNGEIELFVLKPRRLPKHVFGMLKDFPLTGQQVKDLSRKERDSNYLD